MPERQAGPRPSSSSRASHPWRFAPDGAGRGFQTPMCRVSIRRVAVAQAARAGQRSRAPADFSANHAEAKALGFGPPHGQLDAALRCQYRHAGRIAQSLACPPWGVPSIPTPDPSATTLDHGPVGASKQGRGALLGQEKKRPRPNRGRMGEFREEKTPPGEDQGVYAVLDIRPVGEGRDDISITCDR